MDTQVIKHLARTLGADLVGVADLAPLREVPVFPADLLTAYRRGISVAVRLSDKVVDAITPENPTAAYARHYTASELLTPWKLAEPILIPPGQGFRA